MQIKFQLNHIEDSEKKGVSRMVKQKSSSKCPKCYKIQLSHIRIRQCPANPVRRRRIATCWIEKCIIWLFHCRLTRFDEPNLHLCLPFGHGNELISIFLSRFTSLPSYCLGNHCSKFDIYGHVLLTFSGRAAIRVY